MSTHTDTDKMCFEVAMILARSHGKGHPDGVDTKTAQRIVASLSEQITTLSAAQLERLAAVETA